MRDQTSRSWMRRAAFPLLAILAHALAFRALLVVPPRAPTLVPPPPSEIEVAVEPPPVPAPVPVPELPGDPPAGRPMAAATSTSPAASRSVATTSEVEPSRAPSLSGDEPATSSSEGVAIVAPQPVDIGIGGPNRFLPRSAEAVDRAESERTVKKALRDPARERERELGLGPEGPLRTALADGTSRSLAPVRGRAVFVATSNAAGEVVSIELEDAEGGRPGWADAARVALEELKGKRLRLPTGITRAVMKIEVTSAWKLPSGQDPGSNVSVFHIPVSKGETKDSPKVSILEPTIRNEEIELGGPGGPKITVPTIQLDIIGTNHDPSNIGAKPRRVVHTRVLDTRLM